jgi:hypothetical protein
MRIALVGLLALSTLKGCDLGSPERVQPQMEDALRPYFPHVKAVALPQQQTLVGLSCLENVGDEMVKMVPSAVAGNPAMQNLKLLRLLPGSQYSTVSIGFEQSLAVYNINTGAMGIAPMDATYASWYRQQCGLTKDSAGGSGHAWIGYFSGTVQCKDGIPRTIYRPDTLGIWSSREFLDRHLDAEIERVSRTWSDAWTRQNCELSNVKLDAVRDVPVPMSAQ